MKTTLAAAVAVFVLPQLAAAGGPIERACMKSGRQAVSGQACNCIQQVADMTLAPSDQRRAAKLFSDPDEAQQIRFSDRTSDEAFWLRYKSFGEAAEVFCAG